MEDANRRIKVKEIELAYTNQSIGFNTVAGLTTFFRASNPSVLLHLLLEIFSRPNQNGGRVVGYDYGADTWQLTTNAPSGGFDIPIHDVLLDNTGTPTPQSLPDDYEVETGTKVVTGTVVLAPADGVATNVYIVRATWEPAEPGMPQAELDYLFSLCSLDGPRPPLKNIVPGG